jgi:hypothetical protein
MLQLHSPTMLVGGFEGKPRLTQSGYTGETRTLRWLTTANTGTYNPPFPAVLIFIAKPQAAGGTR